MSPVNGVEVLQKDCITKYLISEGDNKNLPASLVQLLLLAKKKFKKLISNTLWLYALYYY